MSAFSQNVSFAMVKAMQHLSDTIFLHMANMTLRCWDAYLDHIKSGIKLDTLAALCNAPLQIGVLFPDDVLRWAEDEITKHDFS